MPNLISSNSIATQNAFLPVSDNALTMTSLDIANLVGSEHRHVKRTIERLAKKGIIQLSPMEKVYNKQSDSPNKYSDVYVFEGVTGKRESIIVVAQLCPEFTAALVDRWQQLEEQVAKQAIQVPQSLPEALRLAASLAEEKAQLESKVEEMRPDVEALERIAKADGSLNITNAAKDLQVRPKNLFDYLSQNRWIYRRAGSPSWSGYQEKIQQGLLEHKITLRIVDGAERTFEQVRITAKGLAKLAKILKMGVAS